MSNKHTPGPWWVSPGDKYRVEADEIYVCHACYDDPHAPNAAANARLIAAAPELLAALERLVEHADLGEVDLESEEREALDQARDVIAKAKGVS